MKQAGSKALAWLGLHPDSEGPRVTPDERRQAGANLLALGLGVLAYFLLRAEMPAEDGFGGYIPLILAVSVSANAALMASFLRRGTARA